MKSPKLFEKKLFVSRKGSSLARNLLFRMQYFASFFRKTPCKITNFSHHKHKTAIPLDCNILQNMLLSTPRNAKQNTYRKKKKYFKKFPLDKKRNISHLIWDLRHNLQAIFYETFRKITNFATYFCEKKNISLKKPFVLVFVHLWTCFC